MHTAISSSVGIVAYLALFAGIGLLFVFVNLLIGKFVRPADPHTEKLEIYECGEPAIGSSFVQFDLRFYVVALIFIIFDVEVAFLFPWATVFGKADHLADTRFAVVRPIESGGLELTEGARRLYRELGVANPAVTGGADAEFEIREGGRVLLLLAIVEGLVFFVVLLIAFAYEWKIGALDWVRSVTAQTSPRVESLDTDVGAGEPALSA
jgi:NADH-quinone oxidoreductase subunit A